MSLTNTFGRLHQSFLENTLTILLLVSFSHGTLAENTYYGTGAGAGTNDVGADNNVAYCLHYVLR
jgi:hypothetical protein